MKKTYIKPETLVVAVNVKANLMDNSIPTTADSANPTDSGAGDITGNILAREVIQTPDPWDNEW